MARFDAEKGFQGGISGAVQGADIGRQLMKKYGKKGVATGAGLGFAIGTLASGLSGKPDPNLGKDIYANAYNRTREGAMRGARMTADEISSNMANTYARRGLGGKLTAGSEAANRGRVLAAAEQSLIPIQAQYEAMGAADELQARRVGEYEGRQGWIDTLGGVGLTAKNLATEVAGKHFMKQGRILPENFGTWTPKQKKEFLTQRLGHTLPNNWDDMTPNQQDWHVRNILRMVPHGETPPDDYYGPPTGYYPSDEKKPEPTIEQMRQSAIAAGGIPPGDVGGTTPQGARTGPITSADYNLNQDAGAVGPSSSMGGRPVPVTSADFGNINPVQDAGAVVPSSDMGGRSTPQGAGRQYQYPDFTGQGIGVGVGAGAGAQQPEKPYRMPVIEAQQPQSGAERYPEVASMIKDFYERHKVDPGPHRFLINSEKSKIPGAYSAGNVHQPPPPLGGAPGGVTPPDFGGDRIGQPPPDLRLGTGVEPAKLGTPPPFGTPTPNASTPAGGAQTSGVGAETQSGGSPPAGAQADIYNPHRPTKGSVPTVETWNAPEGNLGTIRRYNDGYMKGVVQYHLRPGAYKRWQKNGPGASRVPEIPVGKLTKPTGPGGIDSLTNAQRKYLGLPTGHRLTPRDRWALKEDARIRLSSGKNMVFDEKGRFVDVKEAPGTALEEVIRDKQGRFVGLWVEDQPTGRSWEEDWMFDDHPGGVGFHPPVDLTDAELYSKAGLRKGIKTSFGRMMHAEGMDMIGLGPPSDYYPDTYTKEDFAQFPEQKSPILPQMTGGIEHGRFLTAKEIMDSAKGDPEKIKRIEEFYKKHNLKPGQYRLSSTGDKIHTADGTQGNAQYRYNPDTGMPTGAFPPRDVQQLPPPDFGGTPPTITPTQSGAMPGVPPGAIPQSQLPKQSPEVQKKAEEASKEPLTSKEYQVLQMQYPMAAKALFENAGTVLARLATEGNSYRSIFGAIELLGDEEAAKFFRNYKGVV